jgi:hypothetical protein
MFLEETHSNIYSNERACTHTFTHSLDHSQFQNPDALCTITASTFTINANKTCLSGWTAREGRERESARARAKQ